MKNIIFIVQKEFLQVKRNKQILPIIFIVPMVQLLVLVHAATFELKRIDTYILNLDKSSSSNLLLQKYSATERFVIRGSSESEEKALEAIKTGKSKLIISIPKNFERDLLNAQSPKIQFIINSIDGAAAGVIQAYSASVLSEFYLETAGKMGAPPTARQIEITSRYWFNPELNYKAYMVPGILVILVTIIGMMLTSMNIVKEKELGTIEQLNVTPIKRHEFIIGKLFPFWVIANIDLAVGLLLAKILFDIPIVGNVFLLFALASFYLLVVLSVGLLISTTSKTQRESNLLAFFFMMVFILLSGLFTPIDSMPDFAKVIAFLNPMAHFVEIMRRVMLKGAGFFEVQTQFLMLLAISSTMLLLSAWRYKKTSG